MKFSPLIDRYPAVQSQSTRHGTNPKGEQPKPHLLWPLQGKLIHEMCLTGVLIAMHWQSKSQHLTSIKICIFVIWYVRGNLFVSNFNDILSKAIQRTGDQNASRRLMTTWNINFCAWIRLTVTRKLGFKHVPPIVSLTVTQAQIDGWVQERRNSNALPMELGLSCANPSKRLKCCYYTACATPAPIEVNYFVQAVSFKWRIFLT